jgi:hypothetical protein
MFVLMGFVIFFLKDMASFKIAALQKALDDSVPASELELANKQFAELTEKYRDKLESTKSLVAFKEESSGYQVIFIGLNVMVCLSLVVSCNASFFW